VNTVIEFVSFVAIIATLVGVISYSILLRLRLKKAQSKLIQSLMDMNHVKSKLSEALMEIESKKLESTDGFLNFLSESRDWAFKYIEDVEKSFAEFDSAMKQVFQWSDTYGNVSGDSAHTEPINEIKTAYEKYKSNMPNNTNNK
jgi:hypothetical protein